MVNLHIDTNWKAWKSCEQLPFHCIIVKFNFFSRHQEMIISSYILKLMLYKCSLYVTCLSVTPNHFNSI